MEQQKKPIPTYVLFFLIQRVKKRKEKKPPSRLKHLVDGIKKNYAPHCNGDSMAMRAYRVRTDGL